MKKTKNKKKQNKTKNNWNTTTQNSQFWMQEAYGRKQFDHIKYAHNNK